MKCVVSLRNYMKTRLIGISFNNHNSVGFIVEMIRQDELAIYKHKLKLTTH